MESWLARIVDYLLAQSWQIAILTALVATASFALRKRSAHIRYLLWLVVLAKCLAPPIHPIRLPVLPERRLPTPDSSIPLVDSEPRGLDILPVAPSPPTERALPSAEMGPGVRPQVEPNRWSGRAWTGLGWAVGATVLLTIYLLKAVRMQLWLKRHRTPLSFELRSDLEAMLAGQGIGHPPRIWLVNVMGQPFVWGIVRGSIYLPAAIVHSRERKLLANLLGHEASHVIRYDAAVNILQVISQVMFWFHPLVWWANSKIRAEREKCCDETTIARTHTLPEDYSNAIVYVLAMNRESSRPAASLAVVGPVRGIEERIRTMLRPGKQFHRRPSLMMAIIVLLLALLTAPTAVVLSARASEGASDLPPEERSALGKLEYVDHLTHGDLFSVTSIEISSDGRYAYAAAYNAGTVTVFKRDVETGYMERIQTISRDAEEDIHGAVSARLSPCDRYLVSTSVRTNTVHLFERDEATGLLKVLNKVRVNAETTQGLLRLPDMAFSPDSRFAYVAVDDTAEIVVYRITPDGTLTYIESEKGQDKCLDGIRSVAASPDGRHVYTAACRANTLGVFERDSATGQTTLVQVIRDEEGDVHGLAGAFHVICSPDGKFVYSSSGRWNGDSAICVFTRASDGSLSLVQELRDGRDGLTGFVGGNELRISPDGEYLYGLGTRSNTAVAFRRDIETGQLNYLQTFYNTKVAGSDGSASGLGISPDGEYVYVAGEFDSSILIFKRLTATSKGSSQALHSAAASGDIATAQSLLAEGASVHQRAERGYTPLHWAVQAGQKDMVEMLVANGADIHARTGSGGWTPLHLAARHRNGEIVEWLTANRADIDAANQNNMLTPLFIAVMEGDTEMIDLIIDKGADISKRNHERKTALHCAAANGYASVVELLLEHGADLEAKSKNGLTPLHYTCLGGHASVAQLLIERGADTNTRFASGLTLLHLAVRSGDKEIVGLLIAQGADVNATDRSGYTPLIHAQYSGHPEIVELLRQSGAQETLHAAARLGDLEEVKRLLAQGADVNARDDRQRAPLHLASAQGHEAIVKVLLEAGADINARGPNGNSPLHQACRNGQVDVVRCLIAQGANVRARDDLYDWTPLHAVGYAPRNHAQLAELLLLNGAYRETKDIHGRTPLHYAMEFYKPDLAKHMIAKGADIHSRSRYHSTPLHIAVEKNHKDLVDLLLENGADISVMRRGSSIASEAMWASRKEMLTHLIEKGVKTSPIHVAAFVGDQAQMATYLEKSGDANARNESGDALLHVAIWGGHKDIVQLLLRNGADVNVQDRRKWTPLHYASDARHMDMELVELLLANGADVNLRTMSGRSPLYLAASGGHINIVRLLHSKGADVSFTHQGNYSALHQAASRGHKEVVEFLLAHGAKVNRKSVEGDTPLSLARREGRLEIVELLKKHGANE